MLASSTPPDLDPGPSPPDRAPLFDSLPGNWFHLVFGSTLLVLMWAFSVPGSWFGGLVYGVPALGLLVVVWVLRALTHAWARRVGRVHGTARSLTVAPAMLALAALVTAMGLPLQVRWAVSRASFDRVVADAPPAANDDEWHLVADAQRLGLYDVFDVYKVRDAVIFQERSGGGFLDDGGFACMPSGPFPELENGSFENPTFDHLDGCWYAWKASW